MFVPLPVFGLPYLCGLVLRAGSYHSVLWAPTCTPYLCPGRGGGRKSVGRDREKGRGGEGREEKGEGEGGKMRDRGSDRVGIHMGVGAQQISPLTSFPGSSCEPRNEPENKKLSLSHCLVSWPNCKSCLPFLGGWAVKTAWGQGKSRDMSYTPNTPLDVPTARRCVCGRERKVIKTLVWLFPSHRSVEWNGSSRK